MKPLALISTPVVCLFLMLIGLVVVVAPGHPTSALASSLNGCASPPRGSSDAPLDANQLAVARTISSVARSRGVPSHGVGAAIMAGLQESGLRPLRFGDRDSFGVFQQRSAWGPAADRINPSTAARMFFTGGRGGGRGLLDVPDWRHLSLAQPAQAVEVSAYPAASEKWESLSVRVVRRLTGADPACATREWVGPLGTAHYLLTAGFGKCGVRWADCHTGQDFAVPTGTRVVAVAEGVVTFAGWDGPYGNAVHVLHAGGTSTWYAHLSQLRVHRGSHVDAGSLLGLSGATGNTTGPHLHFEVRLGASTTNPGTPIDPLPWLRQRHAL